MFSGRSPSHGIYLRCSGASACVSRRDVGAISAPAARTVRCATRAERRLARGARSDEALGPPTADRRRCRHRSSFRIRCAHAHGASVHRAHAPRMHSGFEATLLTQPAASPRSLRSRTRARNLTKVRGPRARGLWTRAMPDLVRLTTCPRLHSHTLAMPADRGRLRHAPRPRREHGLVAA